MLLILCHMRYAVAAEGVAYIRPVMLIASGEKKKAKNSEYKGTRQTKILRSQTPGLRRGRRRMRIVLNLYPIGRAERKAVRPGL